MKILLISAVALVAAMNINAQVFQMDGESHGLRTYDKTNVEAGHVWGSIEGALDISNAFNTQHEMVDCISDDFTKVIIDGNEILTTDGVRGSDNPKDADGSNPAVTFQPVTWGSVIQLDAKKDGWVYIVAKLSTNKQYMVFEEGIPIGYKIAMESNNEAIPSGVLNLKIKGSGEYNCLTLDQYPGGLKWLIREFTGNVEAASAGNGLGVFYFPVHKDCKYLACGTGTKISWCGVYFSETEAQSVFVEGEGVSRNLIGNDINAQVFQMDGEAHGLASDLSTVEAGHVWGSIEGALDISNAFETAHKLVDCSVDNFTKVVIDGNEIQTNSGVQGNDNPKDADGNVPTMSFVPAVSGAVIQLDTKKDGWVYIVAKLSTNKGYMVFEEGLPIGYKIAMESNNEAIPSGVLNLEIKGSGENNNLTLDQYPNGLKWLIREFTGDAEAASAGNGLGVFYFPVHKDCKYLACATGTKISWCGVYFSETEAQSVFVKGEGVSRNLIGNGSETQTTSKILYTNDLSTSRGTQMTLPIQLDNTKSIAGFQFDVTLPDGIQYVKYEKTSRMSSHSVSTNKLSDNKIRFLVSIIGEQEIAVGTGAVLNLTVSIPATYTAGNYTVTVSNIELTHNEGNNVETINQSDATSKLTVIAAKPGDANGDNKVSVTDVTSIINYILQKIPSTFIFEAADVNGDKKISVTDVTMTINIVLGKTSSNARKRDENNEVEPE